MWGLAPRRFSTRSCSIHQHCQAFGRLWVMLLEKPFFLLALYISSFIYFLLDSCSLFLWLTPGFRKVWHAQRHHRKDLQKMQERVSCFSPRETSYILGEFVKGENLLTNLRLRLLAAISQPFGEAQVDRLDGLVMECINCGFVKTSGCGKMERFQKSSRCVTEEGLFSF